jgi:hypothetical protein
VPGTAPIVVKTMLVVPETISAMLTEANRHRGVWNRRLMAVVRRYKTPGGSRFTSGVKVTVSGTASMIVNVVLVAPETMSAMPIGADGHCGV